MIGDDVWIGANVVVTAGSVINDGCVVGAGAVVVGMPANMTVLAFPHDRSNHANRRRNASPRAAGILIDHHAVRAAIDTQKSAIRI